MDQNNNGNLETMKENLKQIPFLLGNKKKNKLDLTDILINVR